MKTQIPHLLALTKKAADAKSGPEAMHFAQAALNMAHTLNIMASFKMPELPKE